jgi:hypothetical protein
MSPLSSGLKNNPSVKADSKQILFLCSSETSVDFQLTTRRYIPEDSVEVCFLLGNDLGKHHV